MPQDWNESYIVKLPKKGDRRECKNYRGISLMSAVGKVLNRIILLRRQGAVDATLRDQQAGAKGIYIYIKDKTLKYNHGQKLQMVSGDWYDNNSVCYRAYRKHLCADHSP